jgi:uncharacterized protein YndB with AHSA1/START domain
MEITVEALVLAPLNKVWNAYTTPADIKLWNAASDDWHTTESKIDLRIGGSFSSRMEAKDGSFGFDFAGTYTNVVNNELIEYMFGERRVRVEFSHQQSGILVRVTFDPETEHPIEEQQQGWQAILNRFKNHVESSIN